MAKSNLVDVEKHKVLTPSGNFNVIAFGSFDEADGNWECLLYSNKPIHQTYTDNKGRVWKITLYTDMTFKAVLNDKPKKVK